MLTIHRRIYMKIAWNKSNAIGIKAIDQQHQNFFAIINKIFALNQKKTVSKENLTNLVYQLAGYAMFHFSAEENYCTQLRYPGTKQQILAHQKYQQVISAFMIKMQNPRTNTERLSDEIANFSVEWLTNHILGMDKKIGDWCKNNKK